MVPFHGICYSSIDFRFEGGIGNRAIWKWNWKFGIPFGNGKYTLFLSLSLFNCERFEVFSNILNLHSTFLSFFLFPIYHPRVFPPFLRKLWGLYRRIIKYFFTLFFFFNKLYFVSLVSRHYREPDNWGGRRNNALRFHNNNKGGVPQLWLQRLCGIINQIESMSPLWKADLATYSFIIIRGASVLPNLPPSPTSPTISPSFITPS